jgi:hypothetical protein
MDCANRLGPEEFWAHMTRSEEQLRAAAQTLPWYGVADWTGLRMAGDWEFHNGRLARVGLAHGDPLGSGPYVHVTVCVADPVEIVLDLRMAAAGGWSGAEYDFLAVRRRLAEESVQESDIVVDGQVRRFSRWTDPTRWYAATSLGDYGLVVEARELAPAEIRLALVHDVEPYVEGRRAHLRELRGEAPR